jgi:hypothetical protein
MENLEMGKKMDLVFYILKQRYIEDFFTIIERKDMGNILIKLMV